MDLLNRKELEAIATPQTGGTHVSLFMPTHRFGSGIEADKLRWKNLITGVEAILLDRMRRPDVEKLMAPARELLNDYMGWQYMSDGLAMFLNEDGERTYRVPAPMTTMATIGDRTVLGPLMRLLSGDDHFLMLALSQQNVRLLEGSRNTVEEVQLRDVPTSLEDVITPQDPRSDTMARPATAQVGGGGGAPAVFYGHGGGDDHFKQDEVTKYLRSVATGVHDILHAQTSPLVLVGLENLNHGYRALNSYPHLMDATVEHNADGLSNDQLHELAWPVVEKSLQAERAKVFEHFQELNGTGRVSSDLTTVAQAATEGRVETLFVQADPWCWEQATDDREPIIELGKDERYADCEIVDAAAVATLNAGGRIYASSQTVVEGADVAAIFRY